jgi:hypothetical protein
MNSHHALNGMHRTRHANLASFVHMHEKKLTSLRQDITANQRDNFLLRLPEDCGSLCHEKLVAAFTAADKLAQYRIINRSYATVSTSMNNIDQVKQSFPNEEFLLEFAPLLAPVKLDLDVQEHMYDASLEHSSCLEYTIAVTALTTEEFASFLSNMKALKDSVAAKDLAESFVLHEDELAAEKFRYARFVRTQTEDQCSVAIDRYVLETMAQMPEISWIERRPEFKLFNRWAHGTTQTSEYNNVPIYLTANITGAGEIVGVSDSGLDMMSCFFHDAYHNTPYSAVVNPSAANYAHRKVIFYSTQYGDGYDDAENEDAHGTHVSGSVAGSPYSDFDYGDFPKYRGIAYNAKIVFYDIHTTGASSLSPPSDLNSNMFQPMYNLGARIMTNSWGVTDPSRLSLYDTSASNIDRFMWNYPDALVLFAAGNSGSTAAGSPRTIAPPSTNKNGLCVGASLSDHRSWLAYTAGTATDVQDIDSLAYFSSRGPTRDGRLKPDLTAPGFYTTSANGLTKPSDIHCGLRGLSGTSMASPTAAGLAVIVRQYFTYGYYPSGDRKESDSFIPSGALLKAMLVTASTPLKQVPTIVNNVATSYVNLNNYPDNNQGYGRIELDNVLNFANSGIDPISLFVIGAATNKTVNRYAELKSNTFNTYTFRTGSTAVPVRVTLAYSDYPGIESTSSANVIVNTLTLKVTQGSSTFNPSIAGQNVQVIDIASPSASTTYTVTVSAGTLAHTQPYALVIRGQISFLNASYSEQPVGKTTTSSRVKSLQHASISSSAKPYIGVLAAISFMMAVISSYLYCKIRKKNKEAGNMDDEALRLGIQASLREGERTSINRNLRGDHHE